MQNLQRWSPHTSSGGFSVQIRKERRKTNGKPMPPSSRQSPPGAWLSEETVLYGETLSDLAPGRWSLVVPGHTARWAESGLEFRLSLPCQPGSFVQHIIHTTAEAALSRKLGWSDSHRELAWVYRNRRPCPTLPPNLSLRFTQWQLNPTFGAPLLSRSSLPTHSPLARTPSGGSAKSQRKLGIAVLLGDREDKETGFLGHRALALPPSTHLFTLCSSISIMTLTQKVQPSSWVKHPKGHPVMQPAPGADLGDAVQSSSPGPDVAPAIRWPGNWKASHLPAPLPTRWRSRDRKLKLPFSKGKDGRRSPWPQQFWSFLTWSNSGLWETLPCLSSSLACLN